MIFPANWFAASRAVVAVTAEALRCTMAGDGSSKSINIKFTNHPHHGIDEVGHCEVAINHTGPGMPDPAPDKFVLRVFAADEVCELRTFSGASLCGRFNKLFTGSHRVISPNLHSFPGLRLSVYNSHDL